MTDADHTRPGLADAAGRAALFPARAAARAWRGRIEDAADDVLGTRGGAGRRPRARRLTPGGRGAVAVRHRVLERIVAELAASGELDRLVTAALGSPRTLELTDKVLASEETQQALRYVTTSPELRAAIARQTAGLAEELVGGVRGSAVRYDRRAEQVVRRREPGVTPYAGVATRALALAADVGLTIVLFMALTGVVALVSSLVGGLSSGWVAGALLGSGWLFVVGVYFVLFWSGAGQTPGMRLLRLRVTTPAGVPPSALRSLARFFGLLLSIAPLFAGFVPVLFSERRRGLADYLAGTVVVYDPVLEHS